MSILQFTNDQTPKEVVTAIAELQARYQADNKCFYMVINHNDKFQQHNFDLLFFRDILSYYNESKEEHNINTLVPLYQWAKYLEIDKTHVDTLIEGYLSEWFSEVNTYRNDEFTKWFDINQIAYYNFDIKEYIPIYLVNQHEELEKDTPPVSNYYVHLKHLEAIEMIFRSYSLFVTYNEFTKPGFIEIWTNYLVLMEQNALANNLQDIHSSYWLSHCPEIASINNAISKEIN